MSKPNFRPAGLHDQAILKGVQVRLCAPQERERYAQLMISHHYLKSDQLVGEQIRYVAEVEGAWVGLLSWSAAAFHLEHREQWIGWSYEQRRRRLALVANNSRLLLLPGVDCTNLASRVLGLCLRRLSEDWKQHYNHPVLLVETFVDSQLFNGTSYRAQGWTLLGATKGYERSRDLYTEHGKPKQLWVRELCATDSHQSGAAGGMGPREILRAQELPEALQAVEDKVVPKTQIPCEEINNLWDLCRVMTQGQDWRGRKGRDYSLATILAIIILASLCGVVRGQRDLGAFAAKLTQAQLRALRSCGRGAKYVAPKETTFQRILAVFPPDLFEQILHQWHQRLHAAAEKPATTAKPAAPEKPASTEKLTIIAFDGKTQRGSFPTKDQKQRPMVVNAMNLNTGRVIGTTITEPGSNEIPAARKLLIKLGPMAPSTVLMADALHNNPETVRQAHLHNGAQYLLPVKENQSALLQRVQAEFDYRPVRPENLPSRKSPAAQSVGDLSPLGPARPDASRPGAAASFATAPRTRRQVRHRRK